MIPHNGVAVNILYICNIYLTLECTLLTRYKDTNLPAGVHDFQLSLDTYEELCTLKAW